MLTQHVHSLLVYCKYILIGYSKTCQVVGVYICILYIYKDCSSDALQMPPNSGAILPHQLAYVVNAAAVQFGLTGVQLFGRQQT